MLGCPTPTNMKDESDMEMRLCFSPALHASAESSSEVVCERKFAAGRVHSNSWIATKKAVI